MYLIKHYLNGHLIEYRAASDHMIGLIDPQIADSSDSYAPQRLRIAVYGLCAYVIL